VLLVALASAAAGFFGRGLVQKPPPAREVHCPPPAAEEKVAPEQGAPPPAERETASASPRVAPPLPTTIPVLAPSVVPSALPAEVPAAPPSQGTAPARKRIAVPYAAFEGQSQRIIVAVTLNGGTRAQMAVDTGAPGTVIFPRLAERLGLLREGSTRLFTLAGGIGGHSAAALVLLDSLAVGEARTELVPALVTPAVTEAFDGLVGMDFVAGYSVQIDTERRQLVLTELPPGSDRPAGHDEAWWRRTFGELEGQKALWRRVRAGVEEQQQRSLSSTGPEAGERTDLRAFAERQAQEAEKLAARLERYASNNGVPREWRR
jgi:Aspartyl protease